MSRINTYHFGLVVGIDCYPGSDLDSLRASRNDARHFYEWLIDSSALGGGLDGKNVAHIFHDKTTDATPSDTALPNRGMIMPALKRLKNRAYQKLFNNEGKVDTQRWLQSRLYIFFAGHGFAPGPGDAALFMADAGDGEYGNNLSCSKIIESFQQSKEFHEIVCFVDCCRTRELAVKEIGGPTWKISFRKEGEVTSFLLCACGYNSQAFEPGPEEVFPDGKLLGYFTRALVDGLRGGASHAGIIDSTSLKKYVRRQVERTTNRRKSPQVPWWREEGSQPIVFCEKSQPEESGDWTYAAPMRDAVSMPGIAAASSLGQQPVGRGQQPHPSDDYLDPETSG